jgi:hypothetical protein
MINAQRLKEVGDLLKTELKGLGFSLVVFEFGEDLREFRYISNARREDMIGTHEALLLKWKGEKPEHN